MIQIVVQFNDTYDGPGPWHKVNFPSSDGYYQRNSVSPSRSMASHSTSSIHHKSYHIRNLEPGVMYEAKVQARNKYGYSQVSDLFQFSTRSTGKLTYYSQYVQLRASNMHVHATVVYT